MRIIHVGDKIINADRIHLTVDQVLQLRQTGFTQQEVADRMGIDRTFISRLEGLGEIRKGPQVALIGFHLANAGELSQMARDNGVDFILLLSEKDSLHFLEDMKGIDLINHFMDLISRVKEYDSIIFIGSDKRIRAVEAILGTKVIGWEIGISPITEDRWVNPEQLRQLILQLRNND